MLKQNISCLKFARLITRGGSTHAKSYCLVCVFDYSYCELCCQHNTKKHISSSIKAMKAKPYARFILVPLALII